MSHARLPPPAPDERSTQLAFLKQQRDVMKIAACGLTDEQARLTPTVSALSIGGLLKHVASTEQGWIDTMLVRWVVLHIIEETARHAGHADIVREAIDGATAYPLMAAAEGWAATEWRQPWQPPT